MIAHKQYNAKPTTDTITVVPAKQMHTVELQYLAALSYDVPREEAEAEFNHALYGSRIDKFPEGQWVAMDNATGRVVGFTSGMRFNYNPALPMITNWDDVTGYG